MCTIIFSKKPNKTTKALKVPQKHVHFIIIFFFFIIFKRIFKELSKLKEKRGWEREEITMYKAKLQELCQKRKWGLPKYSYMKCGPDHDPRFGASVSVNTNSFDSLIPCKSSKQALNHVAMLAFLHFTSPPTTTTSTITTTSSVSEPAAREPIAEESSRNLEVNSNVLAVRNDPSLPIIKPDKGGPKVEEVPRSLKIQSNAPTIIDDIHCQYRTQLQKYAKQRNLGLPSYSSECGGPCASCFKAKVTVGERVFESLRFFNTSREAENAAAQAALTSLLVENFQKDGFGSYKNLLQELAQREGLCMPLYKSTNYGVPHKPVFKSTVELEGDVFLGKEANSKKLAELAAARVAYVALTKRASTRIAGSSTSLEHESQSVSYPAQTTVKEVQENNGIADSEGGFSSNASLNTNESSSFTAMLSQIDKMNTTEKSSLDPESAASSPIESLVSPPILNSNVGNKAMQVMPSYLLCNKVRVYQEFPNHAFSKGITVLPIADNKWVVVSLEFPNEESD